MNKGIRIFPYCSVTLQMLLGLVILDIKRTSGRIKGKFDLNSLDYIHPLKIMYKSYIIKPNCNAFGKIIKLPGSISEFRFAVVN